MKLAEIAPTVAFVFVGCILAVIGASGVVPLGNPQPSISEPLRTILFILGIVLILAGPLYVWMDMRLKGRQAPGDIDKFSERIAESITAKFRQRSTWPADARDMASGRQNESSVFSERIGHFYEEKQFIADKFVPLLIDHCQKIVSAGGQVFLVIDSGTTLFPFFENLGNALSSRSAKKEEWLKGLKIATNNLPGIEMMMMTGQTNPKDRFSPLAVECHLLPGEPLPVYAAVTGSETEKALRQLRSKARGNTTFIALTTGNWIRLRRTVPVCPVPLARGKGHLGFKQTLINIAQEVYVITPLGKVFLDVSPAEVNAALGFSEGDKEDDKRSYQEVRISNQKAASVKMVSTFRPRNFLLYDHGLRLCISLGQGPDSAPWEQACEIFKNVTNIKKIPHLLFEFSELPADPLAQLKKEFPHENTRKPEFAKKFFSINSLPKLKI